MFNTYETIIMDYLEEFADSCYGKSAEAMIVDKLDCDDWTMQSFRELAIWMCLDQLAQEEVGDDL